jgi:hypothetical protein
VIARAIRGFLATASLDLLEGQTVSRTSAGSPMVEFRAADSLAEALFSLPEPWRGRFLIFLADRATRWAWNGRTPTRKEVADWLGDDHLYEALALMLYTWQGLPVRKSYLLPLL